VYMTFSKRTTLPPFLAITSSPLRNSFLAVWPVRLSSKVLICLIPNAHHLVLHDLHIVHTDLKPENILLVRNDSRTVTIPTPGKVLSLRCPTCARPDGRCAAPWSPYKAYTRINRHTTYRFRIRYFSGRVPLGCRRYTPLSRSRDYLG
jgi:serine/threonine protein kinase